MKVELSYLAGVSALTAVIWMPYVLNRIAVGGLVAAVGYPENPKPLAGWAIRLKAAHTNAIENLVIFAALVLATQMAGLSNTVTAAACAIYFWARVAHLFAYAFRIPWIRTLAFAVGFGAQMALAVQLLMS